MLVVGNSNVSRFTAGIASRIGENGRAKVALLSGRGKKEEMDTVEISTVNKGDENLVVVHAGLNDVLGRKGKDLATHIEEGVKQFRMITSGMVHIVMCTVPEVSGRGVGIERATQEG